MKLTLWRQIILIVTCGLERVRGPEGVRDIVSWWGMGRKSRCEQRLRYHLLQVKTASCNFQQQAPGPPLTSLICCRTRDGTEALARNLTKRGILCKAYHAGLKVRRNYRVLNITNTFHVWCEAGAGPLSPKFNFEYKFWNIMLVFKKIV